VPTFLRFWRQRTQPLRLRVISVFLTRVWDGNDIWLWMVVWWRGQCKRQSEEMQRTCRGQVSPQFRVEPLISQTPTVNSALRL
jgi:hypothetical protein